MLSSVLFWPKHRLRHPQTSISYKITCIGSEYPKNVLFCFENKIIDVRLYSTRLYLQELGNIHCEMISEQSFEIIQMFIGYLILILNPIDLINLWGDPSNVLAGTWLWMTLTWPVRRLWAENRPEGRCRAASFLRVASHRPCQCLLLLFRWSTVWGPTAWVAGKTTTPSPLTCQLQGCFHTACGPTLEWLSSPLHIPNYDSPRQRKVTYTSYEKPFSENSKKVDFIREHSITVCDFLISGYVFIENLTFGGYVDEQIIRIEKNDVFRMWNSRESANNNHSIWVDVHILVVSPSARTPSYQW